MTTHDSILSEPAETRRPLSLSQLRLFHTCSYAWHLRYNAGHLPQSNAAAWRGSLNHEAIRLAYHGIPLEEAHRQVWQQACGSIVPQLERFVALDAEHTRAGRPQTKAAQQWRQDHPEYDAVVETIRAFQGRALGHLRWSERASLADYYAASLALLDYEPDIILPHAILIEGQEPGMDHLLAERAPEDHDDRMATETRGYRPIPATLGEIAFHIVPDVVALDGDGETVRVVDYKTSERVQPAEALAEDAQLHLYVLGLRQNGYILPGQPVEVGHITLTTRGPVMVFVTVDEARHARVIRRLERLARATAEDIDASRIIAQKGLHHPFMSPCSLCDYVHVCDA